MSANPACATTRSRIAVAVVVILVLPVIYNGWSEMLTSWKSCGAVSAHLARSNAAFQQGNFSLAVAEANRARSLSPTDPRVRPALAHARVHAQAWRGDDLLRGADLDEALVDADIVEQHYPSERASVLAFRGLVARQQLDLDRARTLFEDALTLEPANGLAHLGMALEDARDPTKADSFIEHIEAALKARPESPDLQAMLGLARRGVGDMPAAREALQGAVASRSNPVWLAALASVELALQKPENAIASAALATQIDARNAEAWLTLGQALLIQKKLPEAVEALRTSASLQEGPTTLFYLGMALNEAHQYMQAATVLQKLVNSGNREPTTMAELATAMEGVGSYQDAIRIWESLASLQAPKDAQPMVTELVANIVKRANERLGVLKAPAGKPATR